MQIFLDCDGVLADFNAGFFAISGQMPKEYQQEHGEEAFWKKIQNCEPGFYTNLPLMSDAMDLFAAVHPLRPIILTGCPLGDWSQLQKLAWSKQNFKGVPMIVCMSKDKQDYSRPGDVLIDDTPHNSINWEAAGGVFILHKTAAESIAQLKQKGII